MCEPVQLESLRSQTRIFTPAIGLPSVNAVACTVYGTVPSIFAGQWKAPTQLHCVP